MKKTFLILIAIFLIACTDQTPIKTISGDLNRVDQELAITVKFYDSQKELIAARVQIEPSFDKRHDLQGFAVWAKTDNICVIHTLTPRRIDDDRTTTLGHEVLHCIYGEYH